MSLPDTEHSFSFPKISALRVWVTVEGEALQLYTTETLSKQGERFELHMCDQREKKPTNAWNVEFHVDGQWCVLRWFLRRSKHSFCRDEETDSFCKIDKRKPWTTICLFYRSKEYLKSLGFIPNSRSPSPAASSDLEIVEPAASPFGSSARSPSIAAAGSAAARLASLEARKHVVQAELEALHAEQEAHKRVKREELDEIREEIKRVRGGEGDAEEKPHVEREDTSGPAGALDMQNKARSKSKRAEKAACGKKTEVLVLE